MINGKPFLNLENYIELESFDSIIPEIYLGLVTGRDLAQIGNLDISPQSLYFNNEHKDYKPLCSSLKEYQDLENTNPIKKEGQGLNKNQLAIYLKYVLGGYDLYVTYQKELFTDHFPALKKWIDNLVDLEIFEYIEDMYIMTVEAGGISFEHSHPPTDQNDSSILTEFIHIRPNLDRPFYVRDSNTLEKFYINTRVAYWNDQDRHGGDIIMKNTFSLRVDGKFTKQFKEKIFK